MGLPQDYLDHQIGRAYVEFKVKEATEHLRKQARKDLLGNLRNSSLSCPVGERYFPGDITKQKDPYGENPYKESTS
jgi:hypothetical protein